MLFRSGRTAFSIFRFDRRDRAALLYLLAVGGYMIAGMLLGGFDFRYYPTLKAAALTLYTISLFVSHAVLCLMPLILNLREDLTWKAIQSKI